MNMRSKNGSQIIFALKHLIQAVATTLYVSIALGRMGIYDFTISVVDRCSRFPF
jgi:hypothetical protein